ncbi:MAG TPA: D-2-hydroxyacid dehydrogenase [Flavisolibacter sp.]|nr:D-2-hydroxyacid dehydrogenase [Flavisolibacter sp.]
MKIVVLDGHTLNPGDLSWEGIESFGDLTVFDRTPREKILERSQGAEILFTNKTPLDKQTLDQLPSLKYIGVLATGYNIIDVEAAYRNGVTVSNAPGYGTSSVAQMTFALLLELCLHVQRHADAVRNGDWSSSKDWCFWNYPLVELSGKTIGIIGFGDIGQKVADLATAFDMRIVATSRTQTDQAHRKNFEWKPLDELLRSSDVVSLHCPLTADTKGLINSENLKKMKGSAFVINTSRGPLIVEEDLAAALNDGVIAGAGLDVLATEPPRIDNPLVSARNCIISPHIAWATKESRMRLMRMVTENLKAFLGGDAKNEVGKHCSSASKL